MSDVGEIIGRLKLDASQWFAELEQAKATAESLNRVDPTVRVHADTGAALAEIEAVKVAADSVGASGGDSRGTGAAASAAATQDLLAAATARADVAFAAATARIDAYVDALNKAAARDAAAAAGQDDFNRHLLEGAIAADEEAAAIERDTRAKVADTAAGEADAKTVQKNTNLMGGLVGALIAVSSAAPPVAAGALGIAGAMGVAGGVGVLAILGIKAAYSQATTEGDQARATVGGFLDVVNQLEQRAAPGVLNGLTSALHTVRADMPELSRDAGQFSDSLGRIIANAAPGMLSFLHQLMPLFGNAELYIERIVAGLAGFAGSNGFTQFVGYAIANLPNVEAFLGQVVHLAFQLLAAWAPLGQVALPVLTELVSLIASIPLPILTGMIAAVAAGAAAFSLYQAVPAKLLEVVAAEGLLGAASTGMAAAIDLATGPIGWIVGALSLLGAGFMAATQNERDLATATANYTQVLEAQNSVSSETLRSQVAQQAVQQGLISQGQRIGISAETTVNAMLGQRDATKQVAAAVNQYIAAAGNEVGAKARANGETQKYVSSVVTSNVATRQAVTAAKQYAAAMGETTPPMSKAAAAAQNLAGAIDLATTAEYKLQSTSDNADIAIGGMANTLSAAAKAAKDHHASLTGDSAAAASNREAVLSAMSAISKHAQEMRNDGKSAADAKVYTDQMTASLINNAVKAGANRDQVAQLIAKILGIPKSAALKITTNAADAEAKIQAVADRMAAINGTTATVFISEVAAGVAPSLAANSNRNAKMFGAYGGTTGSSAFGSVPHLAGGGTITGAGNAYNDMAGLYALANGEEVVSDVYGGASGFRGLLKGISSGKVRTPAQAVATMGGASPSAAAQVHVHITPKIPGLDLESLIDVRISQGAQRQRVLDERTQLMGWQGKGLLAAPTGA